MLRIKVADLRTLLVIYNQKSKSGLPLTPKSRKSLGVCDGRSQTVYLCWLPEYKTAHLCVATFISFREHHAATASVAVSSCPLFGVASKGAKIYLFILFRQHTQCPRAFHANLGNLKIPVVRSKGKRAFETYLSGSVQRWPLREEIQCRQQQQRSRAKPCVGSVYRYILGKKPKSKLGQIEGHIFMQKGDRVTEWETQKGAARRRRLKWDKS